DFRGRRLPQPWIVILCIVAVCFQCVIDNRFSPDRFLQVSLARLGCDGAITPEVLRRINWTMVLAIPWYQRVRGVELTLRLKTADQAKRDADGQSRPGAYQSADRSSARSAALRASSRAVSLNGLNRHSIAPCSSNRGRTVLSALAVMKMIGIACPRRFNSR